MKRLVLVSLVAFGIAAPAADAATRCVGPGAGCFATLQAAAAAAQDGDTIKLGPGTFAGGVTIDKSVALVGAGATVTTIKGGGPVLTIGRDVDPAGLSVSIRGVTVTGGVNSTKPDPEVTFGGGIWIPTSQLPVPPFNGTGATVSISDSTITGNTVTTHTAIPAGQFCPFECGFANGGGIDNGGVLTLANVRVTDNVAGAGSLASGVAAGGINSHFASTLLLLRTVVSGNRVVVGPPNGRDASSGGIASSGGLTIEDSSISDNSVEFTGANAEGDQVALAGGLEVGQCAPCGIPHPTATIRNTFITGNRAVATAADVDAVPAAFAGGLIDDAPLLIERSVISGNSARTVAAGAAAADGGGMEIDGTVTIRDSLVAHNSVVAEGNGPALANGGGIANFGDLTLERTLVLANSVTAHGAAGQHPFGAPSLAIGGGIWNRDFDLQNPPSLTLVDSVVSANSAEGSAGFVVGGGGLWTATPVTRSRTVIAGNRPDQCHGC